MQDEKIQTVLRQNPQGTIYGITFIDYRTKSVFNGSDLGKQYSVGALQQKIAGGPPMDKQQENQQTQVFDKVSRNKGLAIEKEEIFGKEIDGNELWQQLMQDEKKSNYLQYELLQKKRKKKRKPLL